MGGGKGGGLPERRGQQSLAGKLPTPGVSLSSRFAWEYSKSEPIGRILLSWRPRKLLFASILTFRASITTTTSDTSDDRIWIEYSMKKETDSAPLSSAAPPRSGSYSHMQQRVGAGET